MSGSRKGLFLILEGFSCDVLAGEAGFGHQAAGYIVRLVHREPRSAVIPVLSAGMDEVPRNTLRSPSQRSHLRLTAPVSHGSSDTASCPGEFLLLL